MQKFFRLGIICTTSRVKCGRFFDKEVRMSNLERVVYINHTIKTKGFVTRKEVSDRFEVHIDTVKRDIEYMRTYLSAPIKYRQSVGG